eukprot:EC824468.1.p1 GENE.EC824468.1~~EC824468.1.p1  ORF type:complete len:60 (+),score=26.02 EC824468.1:492-671(+)
MLGQRKIKKIFKDQKIESTSSTNKIETWDIPEFYPIKWDTYAEAYDRIKDISKGLSTFM